MYTQEHSFLPHYDADLAYPSKDRVKAAAIEALEIYNSQDNPDAYDTQRALEALQYLNENQ